MNITKCNNLSFYNEQGILTLNAKQFDTARTFVFQLMDNDEPFVLPEGCTASLRIQKADGTQFQGEDCCIIEGSKITINPALGNGQQILAADGVNICELVLNDSNGSVLTTWNFHINVLKRVHNCENLKSSDDYDVLIKINNDEKIRKANETIRIETENARIEAENTRIETENARIETENTRIEAENTRIETENARIKAENARKEDTAKVIAKAKEAAEKCIELNHTADASAIEAKSWAHGGTGTRTGENIDNAKYYKEQAQEICENLQKSTVTGVKGNAESQYRIGNVTITPENVGALSLKGGTITGSFSVNKTSTTNPSNITELNIDGNEKVKINTSGSKELARFEGTPNDGTISFRGNHFNIYSNNLTVANNAKIRYGELTFGYLYNRTQPNSDNLEYRALELLNDSVIIGNAEDYNMHSHSYIHVKDDSERGAEIQVHTNYLDINTGTRIELNGNSGNISANNNLSLISPDITFRTTQNNNSEIQNAGFHISNDTFWINNFDGFSPSGVAAAKFGNGETRLFGNDVCLGENGDYFFEANRYSTQSPITKQVKIRGGSDASILIKPNNTIQFGSDGGAFEFHSFTNSDKLIASILQNGYMALTGLRGVNTAAGILIDGNTKISGNLRLRNDNGNYGRKLNFGDDENTYISNQNDNLKIRSDELNLAADLVYIGYDSNLGISKSGCFVFEPDSGLYPMADYMTLGFPSHKWDSLYATNGTIQTSDRNEKNHIEELSTEKSEDLIYGLKPSTYRMNKGTSGRTHWGMISQDIEDLLEELGWTSSDFAGFIKSPKIKETTTVTDENGSRKKVYEYVDGAYDYSLRYDEFIAPMIKVIQAQHKQIETLAQKLELLEAKTANLE